MTLERPTKQPLGSHMTRTSNTMKKFIPKSLPLALGVVLVGFQAAAAPVADGDFDFGKFNPPASGGEFVEINIQGNLISMVARVAEKEEPEVAQALRGIKHIRVHVVGLDDQNREDIQTRFEQIRARLNEQGWEQTVNVKQQDQDVAVHLKTRGEEAIAGLVVTVLEKQNQAVLVNIEGDIKPEQLMTVAERFNISPLKEVGRKLEKK